MAKFCPNCGSGLAEAANFCAGCGAQIPSIQQQPSQSYAPPPPPAKKKNTGLFITLGAAALVIIAVVLIVVLGKDNPGPAPVTRPAATTAETQTAPTSPLVGLWRNEYEDGVELLSFEGDGTFRAAIHFFGSGGHINRQSGSYRKEGNQLTLYDITDDEGGAVDDMTFACNVSGDTLALDDAGTYDRVAARDAAAVLEDPFAPYPRESGQTTQPNAASTAQAERTTYALFDEWTDWQQEALELADQCLELLRDKEWGAFGSLVHRTQGLTFSPYGYVEDGAVRLRQGDVKALDTYAKVHTWGRFAGSGGPIKMTLAQYYDRFIFDRDFTHAPQVSVDKIIRTTLEDNLYVFGNGGVFVEYHVPGSGEEADFNWASLRLVFSWEEDVEGLSLVAVVHDEWTP